MMWRPARSSIRLGRTLMRLALPTCGRNLCCQMGPRGPIWLRTCAGQETWWDAAVSCAELADS